jgi:hypothetical protein
MIKNILLLIIVGAVCMAQPLKIPQIDFYPGKYICYRSGGEIKIDGNINKPVWEKAKWTENFIDIEGKQKPEPRLLTRVKMLWDEKYLYIAAELEEPDVWGTLKKHNDTIYFDNAFEVFLDPDGDTHDYCEIEINALNTIWDLLMLKPYRDKKNASMSAWEIKGLKSAISINGTLNNPTDKDKGWTIEIAIPWEAMKELTNVALPPNDHDQWRMNFMRVEWKTEVINTHYKKIINLETTRPFKPDYWVWSPQGLINMHYPEMWGYVQFSTNLAGTTKTTFIMKNEEQAKWVLRKIYYAERNYFVKNGCYTDTIAKLELKLPAVPGYSKPVKIETTSNLFEASFTSDDGGKKIFIQNDGYVGVVKNRINSM